MAILLCTPSPTFYDALLPHSEWLPLHSMSGVSFIVSRSTLQYLPDNVTFQVKTDASTSGLCRLPLASPFVRAADSGPTRILNNSSVPRRPTANNAAKNEHRSVPLNLWPSMRAIIPQELYGETSTVEVNYLYTKILNPRFLPSPGFSKKVMCFL
jgi:hypothetical protein